MSMWLNNSAPSPSPFDSGAKMMDERPDMQMDAIDSVTGANRWGAPATVAGSAAMAAPDFVDQISSSLGITDRGEISQKVLDFADMPGLNQVYKENLGGIELVGGIVGLVVADKGASKAIQGMGRAANALKGSSMLGRIATLDSNYRRALSSVRQIDKGLAARGALGNEAFISSMPVLASGFEKGKGLVTTAKAMTRNQAARKAVGAGIQYGAARNVITEGLFSIGFNQNSMFFSEDFGENLAFAALGIGLGAGIDTMISRSAMKSTFQSDQYMRISAGTFDPTGAEHARLTAGMKRIGLPDDELLGQDFGMFTDEATSLAVQASVNANRDLPQAASNQGLFNKLGQSDRNSLQSRRNAFSTELLTQAADSLQKTTSRGLGIPGTAFAVKDSSALSMIEADPTAFYLASRVGQVPNGSKISKIADEVKTGLDKQQAWVESQLRTLDADDELVPAMQQQLKAIRRSQQDEMMVNLSGTEWVPESIAKRFDDWVEPTVTKRDRIAETKGRGSRNMGMDEDLRVFGMPRGKGVEALDMTDSLRMYRVADHLIKNSSGKIQVPHNASWFQIDTAVEASNRGREVEWPPTMSKDRAMVNSLADKVDILRDSGNLTKEEMVEARIKLNLPQLSSAESGRLGKSDHPIEILARSVKSGDDLRKMDVEDVKNLINQARRIEDIHTAIAPGRETLMGDTMRFMMDGNGKPKTPMIAYKRPYKPHEWSRLALNDRQAYRKTNMIQEMVAGDRSTPLSSMLVDSLVGSPDFALVSNPMALSDASLTGVFGGLSAPRRATGEKINSLVSKGQRDRDNPALRAASRINEAMKKIVLEHYESTAKDAVGDTAQILSNPRNASSRLLVNQFMTFRGGWKLMDAPVIDADGYYRWTLDHLDDGNKKRFELTHGRPLDEGQELLTPQGKPMVVDELGMNFLTGFNIASDDVRSTKNSLLAAMGLGRIAKEDFYVPPPSPKAKFIGFAFDAANNQIPNATIVAESAQDYARQEAALFKAGGPLESHAGAVIRRREDVANFMDLWEKAQMQMMDPNRTPLQPGKQNRGGLQGQEIRHTAVDDSIDWLRQSYLDYAHDVTNTMFREQIQAARTRAKVSAPQLKNNRANAETRGIQDFFVENLTGRLGITSDASTVGKMYRGAEEKIDELLEDWTPGTARTWELMSLWTDRHNPFSKSKEAKTRFEQMTKALGDHMPYDKAADYVESIGATARPVQIKNVTAGLNQFTAAMVLRIGETMHAVMNLSGVVNAIPSVVRHLEKLPGEDHAKWANRLGFEANMFTTPSGKTIPTLDMAKLMKTSFKKAWTRERHVDYDFMQARGYITQEVAEFQKQFGAIDSKNALMRFISGNSTVDPKKAKGFMQKSKATLENKGLIGALSVLSDRSEDFSRAWSHMTGLEVAERLGVKDMAAKHSFAHELANKMIADYNPLNRPEVFQGGIGAPLGLFQSFIWNYYERLFRYVEKGDKRAIATQYAMQGTLFGAVGLPGFEQFNDLVNWGNEGEQNPIDSLNERLGPELGDIVYGGVLSTIPKMFGGEAVDLYSRGDTNVRLPGANPPPAWNMAKKMYEAVGMGIEAFANRNVNLTEGQLIEITSHALSNRPIAGMIDVAFGDGKEIDPAGQLASQTESAMESAFKIMGVRSMRQSRELEAFYANKNAQEVQRSKRETLNRLTRSAIRDKDFDAIPRIFNKYVENGGDPAHYRRWIKGAYKAATETHAERQLDKLMKNPSNWELTERLLDAGVSVADGANEEVEPYGPSQEDYDRDMWMDADPGIATSEEVPERFRDEDTMGDLGFEGVESSPLDY